MCRRKRSRLRICRLWRWLRTRFRWTCCLRTWRRRSPGHNSKRKTGNAGTITASACFCRDLKGAQAAFEKVTEMDPQKPDGWVNIGRAALQEGDVARARVVLEKALAINP